MKYFIDIKPSLMLKGSAISLGFVFRNLSISVAMMMILDKYLRVQKSREEREEIAGQATEPPSSKRKQLQKKPHLENFHSLTDNELIAACAGLNATRRHWQEFDKRYTPMINTRIEATLSKCGIPQSGITWDIANEVSSAVLEKLCDGRSLKIIAGYKYAKAGLARAVENIVWSWNKNRNIQKHAHNTYVNKKMVYLNAPLGAEEYDECLIDVTADPKTNPITDMQVKSALEISKQVIDEIESIKDAKNRLAIKINLMFYNPLSDKDVEDIAVFQGTSPFVIEKKIDAIMARLADKNEKIEGQQELMANKFADLQRQVLRLKAMEKDFNTPEIELEELERDVARKTKELENLNKRNQKVNVYPTAEEVADLLKIPKAKQKDISVSLKRIRERIEKNRCNKKQVFAS